MASTPKSQSRTKTQRRKFIDKARELETDEDEQSFADKLKRIAKAPKSKKPASEKDHES